MSAKRNRPIAGGGVPAGSSTDQRRAHGGTAPTWHAVAKVYEVMGGQQIRRYLLLVNCPYCHEKHLHQARSLKPELRRKSLCGLGVIVVHTGLEVVAA